LPKLSNLGYFVPVIFRVAKGCTSMKIFFSVGEPSGDLHGANLIKELRQASPGIECVGYGGPKMAAAGAQLHADLTQLAVMWILRVLMNLHHFWRLLRRAGDYFRDQRPDAVVLIDYPGFNWWIARAAKKYGIPVFYYGVPQMWAWAPWRVRKMRRLVDHVLCKLPFEADWYRARNCHATYLGHPYFDELERQQLDQAFCDAQSCRPGRLVTILPGSRTQEVAKNLQGFVAAAGRIHGSVPDARFAIASFNEKQAAMAREQIAGLDIPIEVFVGRTPELIRLSYGCLACSGSVSLELLYHAKPTVILYRVGWFPYTLARRFFIKVKFITLVNLLAADDPFLRGGARYDPRAAADDGVLFPEHLTYEDRAPQIARQIIRWLTDEASYQSRVRELEELKRQHAVSGASHRAAAYILQHLRSDAPPLAGPHFELGKLNEVGKSRIKKRKSA
jgi:lipid-A-disaccharide synthase